MLLVEGQGQSVLNSEETRLNRGRSIVTKDGGMLTQTDRKRDYPTVKFDFLGYSFQPAGHNRRSRKLPPVLTQSFVAGSAPPYPAAAPMLPRATRRASIRTVRVPVGGLALTRSAINPSS